jgi:hypothetical protein
VDVINFVTILRLTCRAGLSPVMVRALDMPVQFSPKNLRSTRFKNLVELNTVLLTIITEAIPLAG